ncbi:hypothetical protein, partial [Xenorhabdus anantnagensis]
FNRCPKLLNTRCLLPADFSPIRSSFVNHDSPSLLCTVVLDHYRLKQQYHGENEIIQGLTRQGLGDIRNGLISTLQQERDTMQKDIHQALQEELRELNGLLKDYRKTKNDLLSGVLKKQVLLPALSVVLQS